MSDSDLLIEISGLKRTLSFLNNKKREILIGLVTKSYLRTVSFDWVKNNPEKAVKEIHLVADGLLRAGY